MDDWVGTERQIGTAQTWRRVKVMAEKRKGMKDGPWTEEKKEGRELTELTEADE